MNNYEGTIDYLYALQRHGIKLGLRNITEMLSRLGNPQEAFSSAHIAGTNGKGSTAFALAELLGASGERAGLFTSPHLVSFTERLRVGGEEIAEDDVVRLASVIRESTSDLNPTFFEVVTAMGFQYFREQGVRWAVVETGMGGRLDATNSLSPDVAVITSLALDHKEFLGEGIEDIAREKAGIIKEGVPVVTAPQEPAAMEVLRSTAKRMGAALYIAGEDFTYNITAHGPDGITFNYESEDLSLKGVKLPAAGEYQALNAALAVRALTLLIDSSAADERAIREGLSLMRPPGRLERISDDPPVLIDGAHNPGAARALAGALEEQIKDGGSPVIIIGAMSDKDLKGILEPLLPLAEGIIFTAPGYGRAAAPEELRECARALGHDGTVAPTVAEALKAAVQGTRPVLVTGSFFTIGEAKEALRGRGPLSRVARLGEWQAAG